ncbi:hypothetical protein D3C81_1591180 [compost metagenome]
MLLSWRSRCGEFFLNDRRHLWVCVNFLNHMLRHITHTFSGVGEVLLEQRRVAAVELKLFGWSQRVAVQHIDATAQAALVIAGSINQTEPAGGAKYVERSGDGLARCLHPAGAGS